MDPLHIASRQWMKTTWRDLVAYTPMERTRKVVRLERASADVPFVFPWHYPHGTRTHINVRIDADWCKRKEWENTMEILKPLGKHASWFITTGAVAEEDLDLLDTLKRSGVEIGSHSYFHFTFKDELNNRHNMQLAHMWLKNHGIDCRSFVSPSAKWSPGLQRCIYDAGYVYSSEFGIAHDCLPFVAAEGGLQVPVHPVSPGNFVTKEGVDSYYLAVADSLYRASLPIHFYAHPHDIQYMGKGVVEKIVSLPDVHVSTLLEYAVWWKERRFSYELKRSDKDGSWAVQWSGSDGVRLAVSWDGVTFALPDSPTATFSSGSLPQGKIIRTEPYDFPPPTPCKKQLNWRSKAGLWLDLEYVMPPAHYRISSLKTLINYFLKLLHG